MSSLSLDLSSRPGAWSSGAARLLDAAIQMRYRRSAQAFRSELGTCPRIALPVSYSDKMFWRRIFDHNPAFIDYCDKLATKDIFRRHAPDLALPETLWRGTDPADMPDALRRGDVVVKMNAGSSRNWFFDERPDDEAGFRAACRRWMAQPYGRRDREWAYSVAPRCLFAEQMLEADPYRREEIKFHLFSGEVFYAVVYRGEKQPGSLSAIFDESGRRLRVTNPSVGRDPARALPASYRVPDCFGEAARIARRVAAGSDYLRVDFMVVDGKLYGGEITPYPTAGLMTISDPSVLAAMGRSWDLRRSWFLSTPQRGWRAAYQRQLLRHVEDLGCDAVPVLD
jgi:hypothetical protein